MDALANKATVQAFMKAKRSLTLGLYRFHVTDLERAQLARG